MPALRLRLVRRSGHARLTTTAPPVACGTFPRRTASSLTMTVTLNRQRPHRRPLPFPVPALCSTPRGERASDCRDALRPDSTRCAAAHRAGQGRRVLHAAAPQARGATRSAFYRASMASTPRSHPLRRPSTVALIRFAVPRRPSRSVLVARIGQTAPFRVIPRPKAGQA